MQVKMRYTSRHDALGFAERTLKNLRYIDDARASGEDVHVVTNLVCCLLGLVVIPRERRLVQRVQEIDLTSINGWPQWEITKGSSDTLGDLLDSIRHAVAHGNVSFSSNSREPSDVKVSFENFKPPNYDEPIWCASIGAVGLRRFCENFVEIVDQTIG